MKTYEDFLKKVSEGVEYANSIGGVDECFKDTRGIGEVQIKTREFQVKMLKWMKLNMPNEEITRVIKAEPEKLQTVKQHIITLSAEGKRFENSLLAK